MGIFKSLFGDSSSNKKENENQKLIPWKELKSSDQLKTIREDSKNRTQAIFKHSTRCGISKMALRNFESSFDLEGEQVDLYYLDLLNHKDISQDIAAEFQVFHESPQFIVIRNGETVHHSSHSAITPQVLYQYI
ncbi:bacillithiol system redox-active protein YtxJ [Aquimarina sp. ERC-38]|uniref:bacillithiol system redox-active protein YtxJ n=1 Tax=Aquimarina sp. ERC-38 TaxID=2949996 RepID=UPI0022483770|nr:bacillithiol system redox-active protein YtxJ [Aquimarina sp. ERC-38]UZO80806.1 bacillithiol system redox-active protein YtxJ [Aquimarina sp. ERC-38]